MSALPVSRAALVVRSGYRLLNALYLLELQWLEQGVPAGVLTLANGLTTQAHREHLFAAAANPAFGPWQMHASARILGDASPSRTAILALADESRRARRFRRAVQLYGWLFLTSRESDDALRSSLTQLRAMRRQVYLPSASERGH